MIQTTGTLQRVDNSSERETLQALSLKDILVVVQRNWLLIAASCLVVLLAVGAYIFMAPKQYSATAQLFATSSSVADSADTNNNINQLSSGASYIRTQLTTYPQLVKTERVLAPVKQKLGLTESTDELAAMVTASNPKDTFMVRVTVTGDTPIFAQKVANAVAESLSSVISSSLGDSNSHHSLVTLDVVQKAPLPKQASSPRVKLLIVSGILLGLILGVVLTVIREIFNTKIRSSNDVRSVADIAFLGSVPLAEKLDEQSPIIISHPNIDVSEDYRKIRTNIGFLAADTEPGQGQLLVIASQTMGEGKTTSAVNIATSLAEEDKKVLLIDADLRHPSIANKLNIEGSVGLTHVLSRQVTLKDAIQAYWKSTFHVLPAGLRPANASILLNSVMMRTLLQQALQQYDYVIVDTSPMQVAHDALVFGQIAGGVVLVIGRRICDKRDLVDILRAFDTIKTPIFGFILNYDDAKKHHNGNYYYYYGDEHDSKDKSKKVRRH